MSPTVNFLESNEQQITVPVKNKRRSLWIFPLLWACLLGFLLWQYLQNVMQINDIHALRSRWEELQPEMEQIEDVEREAKRYDSAVTTHAGWVNSRYPWAALLQHFADSIPGDPVHVQWTRLAFDESIEGLRDQIPGSEPRGNHLLIRRVKITLKGKLESDLPVSVLTEMQENMLSDRSVSSYVERVEVDYVQPLLDKNRRVTDLSGFSLIIQPVASEMVP